MAETNSAPRARAANATYAAFWRWHFYAGLLVMPVLMLMALTGGLYLFKDEIDGVLYRSLLNTPPAATATAPQAWADAALASVPGRVVELSVPAVSGLSAKLVVETEAGPRRAVYVDPHDARVLGTTPEGGIMAVVKRVHSLDIAGPVFNLAIEIVAGWAIVMVATGVVLWWPRGQSGGIVTVRGGPKRRMFWRDLHAVVGIFAGAVIVFLAATGMPWSAVWGKEVRSFTTEAGWGRPPPPAGAELWSPQPAHHAPAPAVPWTLQESEIHTHHHPGPALSLDEAVRRVDEAGLPRPYTLTIPRAATAAWSASYLPAKAEAMRTLYLEGGDGHVIADVGYGQFGPAAKTIEWGIAVHQGKQFGWANKLVMAAGCVAVWLLGLSALVMWWKRRPSGRLAAPPRPIGRKGYVALAAVIGPLCIVYPLVGASLAAVLTVDLGIRRLAGPRRFKAVVKA